MRLQAGSWLRGYKRGRGYAATSGAAATRLQAGSPLCGYKRGRGYAATSGVVATRLSIARFTWAYLASQYRRPHTAHIGEAEKDSDRFFAKRAVRKKEKVL